MPPTLPRAELPPPFNLAAVLSAKAAWPQDTSTTQVAKQGLNHRRLHPSPVAAVGHAH